LEETRSPTAVAAAAGEEGEEATSGGVSPSTATGQHSSGSKKRRRKKVDEARSGNGDARIDHIPASQSPSPAGLCASILLSLSLSLSAPETTTPCLGRRQHEHKSLCRSDKIASQ
jgi:hypothetical protein